jgi:hypothetical protein
MLTISTYQICGGEPLASPITPHDCGLCAVVVLVPLIFTKAHIILQIHTILMV